MGQEVVNFLYEVEKLQWEPLRVVEHSMGARASSQHARDKFRKLPWAGQLETSGWLLCISDAGCEHRLVG